MFPNTARMRMNWLPTLFDRSAQVGFSLSAGGWSGCGAMWQNPQLIPTRNGRTVSGSAVYARPASLSS